jgi:hypothetical protein
MTPHSQPTAEHLTGEQFGELLAAFPADGTMPIAPGSSNSDHALAELHVRDCPACAAELASLRESLSLFREATNAYANHHVRLLPPCSVPVRHTALQPAYWAAAAAVLLAALVPMQMLHRRVPPPAPMVTSQAISPTPESDEALLEDVNREVSESVPTPMQALADPTASVTASSQPSSQRKD